MTGSFKALIATAGAFLLAAAGTPQTPAAGIPVPPAPFHLRDASVDAPYQALNDNSVAASNVVARADGDAYTLLNQLSGRIGSDAWRKKQVAVIASVQSHDLLGKALEAQLNYLRSVEPRLAADDSKSARGEEDFLSLSILNNQKNSTRILMLLLKGN